jgi:hypothetical protein
MDGLGSRFLRGCRASCPYKDVGLLINRELPGINEFGFQIVDVVVIQIELSLERPVCHPPMALQ